MRKKNLKNHQNTATGFFSTFHMQTMVALLYFRTFKICTLLEVKCEIYSCALEPYSTDSLGHKHCTKNKSSNHTSLEVKCKSKAT